MRRGARLGSAPLLPVFLVTLLVGCASPRAVAASECGGDLDQRPGVVDRLRTGLELARQQHETIRVELAGLIRDQAAEATRQSVVLAQRLDTLSTMLSGLAARVEALATSLDRLAARSERETLANALTALTARVDAIDERVVARESGSGVAEATPGVSSMAPGAATISGSRAMPFADPRPGTESTPRDLYQAAYLDFSRGNYALAIGGFREFVRRHPDDEVADNAQYWIGEAYLSLAHRYQDAGEWQRTDQALREAAQSFHEVAERYPIADKVPAALYKEALVLLELQQPAPARDRLEYLIDRFPGSPEARLARQRVAESEER
jgi:tol-pal system protein YbgF